MSSHYHAIASGPRSTLSCLRGNRLSNDRHDPAVFQVAYIVVCLNDFLASEGQAVSFFLPDLGPSEVEVVLVVALVEHRNRLLIFAFRYPNTTRGRGYSSWSRVRRTMLA